MLEVSLLGPVGVIVDGEWKSIGSAAQRAVLAALAVRAGEVVSADRLIEAIWGDDPPPSALAGLHVYVARLRKAVGSDHLVTEAGGYALAGATTDVAAFERLAGSEDSTSLADALELWRGEPFGDLADRAPFRLEARRLAQIRAAAEERRVDLAVADDPRWAVAAAEALCAEEPLHESRWMLLARARAAAGQTAAALRALAQARHHLAEVGLEASAALTQLEDKLLLAPPSVASTETAMGVAVPPLATPLFGRENDLVELGRIVTNHRLVTLVGPGGVGKTYLARALAQAAPAATPPARWCDLAPEENGSTVVAAIARAVGAPVSGNIEETLVEALRPRSLLLVLDNCEHLVAEVARVVSRVLASCPDMRVLATSRVPLTLAAERVWPVQPLDPARAGTELFLERAQAAGTPVDALEPAGVARLCRVLDGLPLAIAMAAAQTRALGLATLEERLERSLGILETPAETVPGRHRTLAGLVAWSVDLLGSEECVALERVATFAGSFTLEAAEAVVGVDPISPDDVVRLLAHLVDRSLLAVQHLPRGTRFRMLSTVRRVVRDRTSPADAEAGRQRHGAYYASLAAAIEPDLFGRAEQEAALRALDETVEFRTAVFNSVASDPAVAIQVCASLFPLVYNRLRADIAGWGEQVFEVVEPLRHPLVPVVGAVAAVAAIQRGDLEKALDLCGRARRAAVARADVSSVVLVEGDLAAYLGRVEDVEKRGNEMLAIAKRTGSRRGEVMAGVAISLGRLYGGDGTGALAAVADAERAAQDLGSAILSGWIEYVRGEALLDTDPDKAQPHLERALGWAADSGNLFVEGVAGLSLASLHARHGDPAEARAQFSLTIRHWLEVGDWIHQWVTLRNLAPLLHRLGDSEGAAMVLSAVDRRQRPSYGDEAARLDQLEQALRQVLPSNRYDDLEYQASRLTDRQVVDLALARLKSAT